MNSKIIKTENNLIIAKQINTIIATKCVTFKHIISKNRQQILRGFGNAHTSKVDNSEALSKATSTLCCDSDIHSQRML